MPSLGSGARGLAPASLMHTAGQGVPYGLLERWRQRDWKLLLLFPKLLPPAPTAWQAGPFWCGTTTWLVLACRAHLGPMQSLQTPPVSLWDPAASERAIK